MFNKIYSSVLTATLALVSLCASAQSKGDERGRGWCGAVAEQERYFAEHPGTREAQKAFYLQMEALATMQQRSTAGALGAPDVTIPVVVHVIHSGGSDNISDRQINSAIDQLNTDYQKLNADTANTLALFKPIAASLGFQFRLAKKDPNGNCTNGITRHYAPNLVNDNLSGAVQAVSIWDRNRYLNIWIVGSIGTPTAGGGTILGYSNLPQNSTSQRDGFVMRGDYFGNQGTSSPSRALTRTATHEIGHYFGLLHPWGATNTPGTGDCTGTDFVDDTPPTDGTYACDLTYAPCGPVADVQNFMDYAACPTMFTQGQKALMRSILNTRPERTGLTTAANLIATGTNDGYVAPACAPLAAFALAPGTGTSFCVNSPVTLRDYSSNYSASGGTPTYTWSFPGGDPSTASGPNPTVRYPNAGFYSVTETVSNSVGNSSKTLTNIIRVEGPNSGEIAPYAQSFENVYFPFVYPSPSLRNFDLSGTTNTGVTSTTVWERQNSLPAADGAAYLYVHNRYFSSGAISTLISPNINLSSVPTPAVLSFARAFALRTTSSNDQLRVSFSNTCGVSWSTPTVLDATALSTKGTTPIDGFEPVSRTDWQTLSVPIPTQYQGSAQFKVRLQMVNGTTQGNNFYLDNLRVTGPLATKAAELAGRGISVYPNPLTNETAVHLNLPAATEVQLSLTDLLGRTVLSLPAKKYAAGQQTLPLQTVGHALRAGIYVVRILLDGEAFSSKLTVE